MNDIKDLPVSDAVRKLNPDLYPPQEAAGKPKGRRAIKDILLEEKKPGGRNLIRQNTKGENKAEARFREWLENSDHYWDVIREGLGFRLGNGVTYWPDYTCRCLNFPKQTMVWEVKGSFMEDDSAVKIKVAARAFPQFAFYLVSPKKKKDGGGWHFQEVKP